MYYTTLNWKPYPKHKPVDCGKCLVELWYQHDLGLQKYLWFVNWNCLDEVWEDFSGSDDIKKGAVVKKFVEDKFLWHPK
jgi:hypothetical protein